jgi:hypothetical protein
VNIQTPAARSTDPNSSHDAERHINQSGVRARQQNMAAQAVKIYAGMTSLEIAEKATLCRYMLARRLPECETAGQVYRGQERRCRVSGRMAGTWWPIGSAEQLDMFARERVA